MPYKLFLVEDEVMTREGIRDSIPWAAIGYQFCGEAPDGEIALPLIREQQPEVVITDIKMPFMDGLQLSRILRDTMPSIKIIILSGHDEFKYAQEAIHVGVTEYLLKPLSSRDLQATLRKVGDQIEQERQANAQVAALQAHLSDQQALLRERCISNILVGNLPSTEILNQCRQVGIELVAPWYQALLLRIDKRAAAQSDLFEHLNAVITHTLNATPDLLWCKQDLISIGMIVRGDSLEQLQQSSQRLAHQLRDQAATLRENCITISVGSPVERISAIAQSFAEATTRVISATHTVSTTESAKSDSAVLDDLLKSDTKADIEHQTDHQRMLVDRACAYIEQHYADPDMSLNTVAATVMLSPSYFSMVFGREVGETFIEFLTKVRMRHAMTLLRTTALPSTEIAMRVGYQNPRYFHAVFRKATGQSPIEFRRRA